MVQSLQGKVIVECSELSGINRSDLEGLKRFMSSRIDGVRIPYDRLLSDLPRGCIIVGTTNNSNPLPNDEAGNRRFIPIRVEGQYSVPDEIRKDLPKIRVQLWAEAVHRFCAGEPAFLPPEEREELNQETLKHEKENEVLDEAVRVALNESTTLGEGRYIKMLSVTRGYELDESEKV